MKKIYKKLIVSDFDGTLITSSHNIPDRVSSAIQEYVECGGVFAVCTGRMLRSILPRVRQLGLKGLVVAYQGSVIAEIESGKIIKKSGLSVGDAVEICRYIEDCGYCINAYSEEILYTDIPKEEKHLQLYEKITGVEANSVDGKISDFIMENNLVCQKLASLVAPADREKLYRGLSQKFGDRFDVTCSAEVLVEISPLGDNKGEALKFIAEYYGIPLSSTVAVGDNLNDLTMIITASVGVAVGNAVDSLKQAADFVSVANDECAVAQIIEKFGFK